MSGSADNAIEVRGLAKTYPADRGLGDWLGALLGRPTGASVGRPALGPLDFDLPRGSSLALVGRNGSGKTTLLRLIAGILDPSRGSVRVHGQMAALLDLGAGVDPEFSGAENARLLGVLSGATRRQMGARIEEVREFSGLGEAFDDPVRSYSSGMVLRLAFSAAVTAAPQLILIDEVLAVGDAFFQQRCLRKIRQLQRDGCTIVLVTHDPAAAIAFCDRAIWLERGRVAAEGEPAKVMREYLGARFDDSASLESAVHVGSAAERAIENSRLVPADGIPHIDHRYGDSKARIEGVALRDELGVAVGEARPGQNLRVVVTIRCLEPIAHPLVGFSLRDRLGEIISATNSLHEGTLLPALEPGDRLSVEFSLVWPPFASGAFSISPAIANGSLDDHRMSDWIDNAIVFETIHPAAQYGRFRLPDVRVEMAVERANRDSTLA